MRSVSRGVFVVSAIVLGAAAMASVAGAAGRAPIWHKAIEVPGTAPLNKGGGAQIRSISCASPGNCGAGGSYIDGSGHTQAFVVSEKRGTWGKAIEVPGTAALNKGGNAWVNAVSCASAGDCSAGGVYTAKGQQVFVVSEKGGTWAKAIEVPGTPTLNTGSHALINALSCASAGNCAAGGDYTDRKGHIQVFVANQKGGTWAKAIEVPGMAALNFSLADLASLSCARGGTCSAGGYYSDISGRSAQAFVVSQKAGGSWGKAIEVPGTAALNKGGSAGISSVSCTSSGNCGAGGSYVDGSRNVVAFAVSEKGGSWRRAIDVPGSASLGRGVGIEVVSCPTAGNCSAVGGYDDLSGQGQVLVVRENNYTWGKAIEMPGTAALNKGAGAFTTSLSCGSAGNCSAGGYYRDALGGFQAFVVTERAGAWGHPVEVPGTAALNKGGLDQISSVSCATAGNCAAGGAYTDASGHAQAFVVSES